jgi:hypothetical protein
MHTDNVGQVDNLPRLEKPPLRERDRMHVADFQSAAGYQPVLQMSGFGAR